MKKFGINKYSEFQSPLRETLRGFIHDNPVRAGLVEMPDNYLYSSAKDYVGIKGLVKVLVV